MKYLFLGTFVILLVGGTVMAHKVNLFAYAESYFPDGKVMVYDSQDQLVLEGITDSEGYFNFDTPKIDDFNIGLSLHRSRPAGAPCGGEGGRPR